MKPLLNVAPAEAAKAIRQIARDHGLQIFRDSRKGICYTKIKAYIKSSLPEELQELIKRTLPEGSYEFYGAHAYMYYAPNERIPAVRIRTK